VLFCIDLSTGEPVAALSFHIDANPRAPVLLTAFALRDDEPALADLALACVGWMLFYLIEVSVLLGRPAAVGYEIPHKATRAPLNSLGFVAATAPAGWGARAGDYLEFRARLHQPRRPR
jgi:hypothetical protein